MLLGQPVGGVLAEQVGDRLVDVGVVAVDEGAVVGDEGQVAVGQELGLRAVLLRIEVVERVDHPVEVHHRLVREVAEHAGVPRADDRVGGQGGADPGPGLAVGLLDRAQLGIGERAGLEDQGERQGDAEDGGDGQHRPVRGPVR